MQIEIYDNNEIASRAQIATVDSYFSGKLLKSMTIGAIATEPMYRRKGHVRSIFEEAFDMQEENNWALSFLHPFSFSYYRTFGYEKVADQLILEFPMSLLKDIGRNTNVQLLKGQENLEDALYVYNLFASKRNIVFHRYDGKHFFTSPNKESGSTYICYDKNGKANAYVSLGVENCFKVNRMESINLNVYELAFINLEGLYNILGFIRIFEGENETVKIHNCAMIPELDLALGEYSQVKYNRYPDLMARILDLEKVFNSHEYPMGKGHFTVSVEGQAYGLEFEKSKVSCRKLDTLDVDLEIDIPSLTQLMYGYKAYNLDIISYMRNVKIYNEKSDFFSSFPKKYCGLFEHF